MSTDLAGLTIRKATEEDRHQLANLIHFEIHVHRHLDWREPVDWLGHHPYLVAEKDKNLLAALACPPDPVGVAWIRLFAARSRLPIQAVWEALWSQARRQLRQLGQFIEVSAIPLQGWFRNLLEATQFYCRQHVVVLAWKGEDLPRKEHPISPAIRFMDENDLPGVEEVDSEAFSDIWRMSLDSLRLAYRQAAIARVVEIGREIVAYQICTNTSGGGHLARLAVKPQYQGEGIGYALVLDALAQFERRGVSNVTVNTQDHNSASLKLYRKAGFQPTGEVHPVYQFKIEKQ